MNARVLPLALLLAPTCRTAPADPGVAPVPGCRIGVDAAPPPLLGPGCAGSRRAPGLGQTAVEDPTEEGWSLLLEPCFFAYGLKGSLGTGNEAQDIDADFDELLDRLSFGGMLQLEARPPDSRWTLLVDLTYAQIEDDGQTPGPAGGDVEARVDEAVGELSAACEVIEGGRLELLGGVRYWYVSAELEAELPGGAQTREGSEDWLDPLVGARTRLALGSHLDLLLRGDLGGFRVGSEFGYNLALELGWTLSGTFQVALGYRQMYVDYEEDVSFDMTQAGPTLGLAIRL